MDMYTAWAAKVAAIARKGKLHNGREGFGDWLHAHMHSHLRRKGRTTWAEAVNRQFAKLEDLPAFGGVAFDLTMAEIPADTPRIAELRRYDREHRRVMEEKSSPAWNSAVQDLERRNHENALVSRIRRLEAYHARPEPPQLSSSTLKLLEVRPSIKHEAGVYVPTKQEGKQ